MRARGERGSASAEIVIIAPILILMTAVALTLGRLAIDRGEVAEAARAAAEAASVWPTAPQANEAAQLAAAYSLVHDGLDCLSPRVVVDAASLAPGGELAVTVSCTVQLESSFGLPGAVTLVSSAVAPIETYRELG
jgi:hypothetical protein